mmetsp:Transcript_53523/g.135174  ORF Transcript_53523/g.135174 Transcript_53523/m.135174 type:complete len:204 (+) Transcript_53523:182-793(+)
MWRLRTGKTWRPLATNPWSSGRGGTTCSCARSAAWRAPPSSASTRWNARSAAASTRHLCDSSVRPSAPCRRRSERSERPGASRWPAWRRRWPSCGATSRPPGRSSRRRRRGGPPTWMVGPLASRRRCSSSRPTPRRCKASSSSSPLCVRTLRPRRRCAQVPRRPRQRPCRVGRARSSCRCRSRETTSQRCRVWASRSHPSART